MSKNKNSLEWLSGVLVGGGLGVVFGLLVAPRSGKQTRQLLKKSADALPELAEDLSTSVQLMTDNLSESAQRNWQETLIRLQAAIAAGVEASKIESQNLNKTADKTLETYTNSSNSNSNNL